jgi:glutathione S-transferase
MRLYHSPLSPYVRKVVVLLDETGQLGSVELVAATGSPVDAGTMPVTQNPLGKIPCLERSDGPALYDSRVITRYLDSLAGGRFYPAPPRLWECLTLEATADGIMDAALLARYEVTLRPEALRLPAWEEGQWQKIARSLDALESRWSAYLAGPLCMGQLALACALGYLDFRHGHRGWRTGRPELARWQEAISARPSLQATVPVA